MKILVLGNGFDLDHNLPTSYMDFLNFCNYVVEGTSESFYKLNEKQRKSLGFSFTTNNLQYSWKYSYSSVFLPLLKNNHLLKYFNTRVAIQGENWIDFEREIKSIVNEFKAIEFEFKQSNQYSYKIDKKHKINKILKDLGLDYSSQEFWEEYELLLIHKKLCSSLDDFSKALEYYISSFINYTPVKGISPDIVYFDADKVITFNYSNTYERIYGGIHRYEDVDYVHGVARENYNNAPNIILGITTNNKNLQNYYVEFEKYYQRITKKTGSKYKKWLQQGKVKNEKMEVMFFGHSLDSADRDIIRDLIYYDNSIVKIYYHNEQAYQQIVTNLVDIIGKDDLIDFVWDSTPKIKFIQQHNHCIYHTAGLEITHDIRTLSKLPTLNSTEINELINKITEKIKSIEWPYFYSQRKVISLFDSLNHNGLKSLIFTQDDFLKICEKLNFEINKSKQLVLYDIKDWYHISQINEEILYDKETSLLIDAINTSNKKRFQEYELSKSYAKILKLESSEEVKEFLLKLFEQDCPYDDYSKYLRELFKPMYEKKDFFEEAFQLIETAKLSLSTKVKFRCFKKDYDEYVDNIEYQKSKQPYGK